MYISEALAESVSVSWIMLGHYGNSIMEDTCNASGGCDFSPDSGVMAEIEWYSVTAETDGEVREVYNGSRASAVLDLEPGQHRLRVKAYSNANGVSSEYSDYVFVIVEESQISFPLSSFGLIISVTLAIMGSIGFFFLSKNTLKARVLSIVKRD